MRQKYKSLLLKLLLVSFCYLNPNLTLPDRMQISLHILTPLSRMLHPRGYFFNDRFLLYSLKKSLKYCLFQDYFLHSLDQVSLGRCIIFTITVITIFFICLLLYCEVFEARYWVIFISWLHMPWERIVHGGHEINFWVNEQVNKWMND
jgi:hypothetical protein